MQFSIKAYLKNEKIWVDLNQFVMENCNMADCYMFINGKCCYVTYFEYGKHIEIKKVYSDDEAKIVFEILPAKYTWELAASFEVKKD